MGFLFKGGAVILLTAVLASCGDVDSTIGRDKKKATTYSFACLDSALAGRKASKHIDKVGDLVRDIGVSEKSITDEVQSEYGKQFHDEMVGDGSFKLVADPALATRLNKVLQDLLKARDQPSKIDYQIYAIDDTMVNAFTFGGRIYLTKGMLKKCEGKEDLLYAITGHEIGYSESGHIKATIQEMELSQKVFGKGGLTIFQLKRFLTAATNQKNELEADYYGINLTNELGYDVCTAVAFWREMASNENSYNQVEDFFQLPFFKPDGTMPFRPFENEFQKRMRHP